MTEAAIVLLRRPGVARTEAAPDAYDRRAPGLWSLMMAAVFAASAALTFAAVVILGGPTEGAGAKGEGPAKAFVQSR